MGARPPVPPVGVSFLQAERINRPRWAIPHRPVQIHPTRLPQRIAIDPAPQPRVVEAVGYRTRGTSSSDYR